MKTIRRLVSLYADSRDEKILYKINTECVRYCRDWMLDNVSDLSPNESEQAIYDTSSWLVNKIIEKRYQVNEIHLQRILMKHYNRQFHYEKLDLEELNWFTPDSDQDVVNELIYEHEWHLFNIYVTSMDRHLIDTHILHDEQVIRFRLAIAMLEKVYIDRPWKAKFSTIDHLTKSYMTLKLAQIDPRLSRLLTALEGDQFVKLIEMIVDAQPLNVPTTDQWNEIIEDTLRFDRLTRNKWTQRREAVPEFINEMKLARVKTEEVNEIVEAQYKSALINNSLAGELLASAEGATVRELIDIYRLSIRDLNISTRILNNLQKFSNSQA